MMGIDSNDTCDAYKFKYMQWKKQNSKGILRLYFFVVNFHSCHVNDFFFSSEARKKRNYSIMLQNSLMFIV